MKELTVPTQSRKNWNHGQELKLNPDPEAAGEHGVRYFCVQCNELTEEQHLKLEWEVVEWEGPIPRPEEVNICMDTLVNRPLEPLAMSCPICEELDNKSSEVYLEGYQIGYENMVHTDRLVTGGASFCCSSCHTWRCEFWANKPFLST